MSGLTDAFGNIPIIGGGASGGGPLGFMNGGNTPQDKGYGIGTAPNFSNYSTGPGLRSGDGSRLPRVIRGTRIMGGGQTAASAGPGAAARAGGGGKAALQQRLQGGGGQRPQSGGPQMPQQLPQMQGQGTQAPQGWDFSRAGVGEQFFDQTQGGYFRPGMGEGYAQAAMGAIGHRPQVSNNAQGAYSQFQRSTPEDLSPYYENAKRRAAEGINTQAAARGSYGSSAAMDQISEAFTNLEADRANREGQYGLSRAGMAGNLAQGADSSSRGVSSDALGWLQGGAGIANNAQQLQMQRLGQGQAAASSAEQLRRQRGRDYFGDVSGMGQFMAGMTGNTYDQMLQDDAAALDASMGMTTGLAREALNQSYHNAERQKADAKWGADMFGSAAGGFMGK